MELGLPINYVEVEQEEMMYLDGGWSINQVVRNCVGLTAVGDYHGLQTVLSQLLKRILA